MAVPAPITTTDSAVVVAVCCDDQHRFSKPVTDRIRLLTGVGVQGDCHAGQTVQHRSRPPAQPNLRQVHLIAAELHEELARTGFAVAPGQLGENITTRGVDLLSLPRGALLRLGGQATVEITGLRNPCRQIDGFRPGLLQAVLYRDEHGRLIRKVGVMGVVQHDGEVRAGDRIAIELPAGAHEPLAVV